MKNKKELINPESINPDSLKKSTVKQIRKNSDLVERTSEKIITEDGKELLL